MPDERMAAYPLGRLSLSLLAVLASAALAGPGSARDLEALSRDPQSVVPKNSMPAMGTEATEARDVVAYLYSLR